MKGDLNTIAASDFLVFERRADVCGKLDGAAMAATFVGLGTLWGLFGCHCLVLRLIYVSLKGGRATVRRRDCYMSNPGDGYSTAGFRTMGFRTIPAVELSRHLYPNQVY